MQDLESKNILVAPLNWGLGHATRCIPIIKGLLSESYRPILASDGEALLLLRKEFPTLKCIELPSYNITYSKKGSNFKKKLLKDSPHLLRTIRKEKEVVKEIVDSENIVGIISDNRFGVRHKKIPSVFITHQLKVLSGKTTWLSTKLHQKIISKFDACWVPDHEDEHNLSGDLSHGEFNHIPVKYIGPLSRLNKRETEIVYDLMVLLSGPEPQRTYLEQKLFDALNSYTGKVLFVRGKFGDQQIKETNKNISVYNYMTSFQLEEAINRSALVLSRSGYTTIMDLAKLEKQAFFIPTPGQYEQEYLAQLLDSKKIVPYCRQEDFELEMLNDTNGFSGFVNYNNTMNLKRLFRLFEGE